MIVHTGNDVTTDLTIVTHVKSVYHNSLDIDFIHGNIHDRSCKKHASLPFYSSANLNQMGNGKWELYLKNIFKYAKCQ